MESWKCRHCHCGGDPPPPPPTTTPHHQTPSYNWNPPHNWDLRLLGPPTTGPPPRDGWLGRSAFTLTKRTCFVCTGPSTFRLTQFQTSRHISFLLLLFEQITANEWTVLLREPNCLLCRAGVWSEEESFQRRGAEATANDKEVKESKWPQTMIKKSKKVSLVFHANPGFWLVEVEGLDIRSLDLDLLSENP